MGSFFLLCFWYSTAFFLLENFPAETLNNCLKNGSCLALNDFFLNLLDNFDDILINLFPKIFALNRRVVLKIK